MARPVREIPVTEARTHLSALVDQARYQGVAVVLTKHGRAYARLDPLADTDARAGGAETAGQAVQTGRAAGPAWPDGLAYRMVALAKVHRDFVARRLSDLGLYVGQELLLARMWEQDGLPQSELVSRLQVE